MAKKKYIETPEKMWEYFLAYKKQVKENPIIAIEQKKGSIRMMPDDFQDIDEETLKAIINPVFELPLERPLTFVGFQNYLDDQGIITDVTDYFENKDKRYSEYIHICSRVKRNIKDDQISGGMTGIYNASITQRLNGLVDKKETEIKGTLNIPKIPNIGKRK